MHMSASSFSLMDFLEGLECWHPGSEEATDRDIGGTSIDIA